MTLTAIDPKTALIVIDLQQGIVAYPTVHPIEGVVANAATLAAAFRAHRQPVVLVNVTGGAPGRIERTSARPAPAADWAQLVPELDQQPDDIAVTKQTWGAFASTDLHEQLQALGVTQVVVCGVSTSAGVESTAREAHALGYNVTLAIDAMTDMVLETHDHSVAMIFPRIGETGATIDVIALLDS